MNETSLLFLFANQSYLADVEKMTKMSKLLEILCNPTQRVQLDTLLKCEKALEKMDLFSYSGQQFGVSNSRFLSLCSL